MGKVQLGSAIRHARMARGLSQSALATRAGTTQDAISRIERGAEEPSLARFERLLLCLGLRPEIELAALVDHEVDSRASRRSGPDESSGTP